MDQSSFIMPSHAASSRSAALPAGKLQGNGAAGWRRLSAETLSKSINLPMQA